MLCVWNPAPQAAGWVSRTGNVGKALATVLVISKLPKATDSNNGLAESQKALDLLILRSIRGSGVISGPSASLIKYTGSDPDIGIVIDSQPLPGAFYVLEARCIRSA